MAGESEVTQVQLTEDGTRPVDLPSRFKDVAALAASFDEAQSTITRLSQLPAGTVEPKVEVKPAAKKTDEVIPVVVQGALDTIAQFNEDRRSDRFTAQVGVEGMAALDSFLSGEAIPAAIKASYDAAIATGNEALIDANFAMVKQVFEAENGAFENPTNMVAGQAAGAMVPAGTTAFRSLREQLTAQKDERYKTDSAFRQDVEHRIAISGPYTQV